MEKDKIKETILLLTMLPTIFTSYCKNEQDKLLKIATFFLQRSKLEPLTKAQKVALSKISVENSSVEETCKIPFNTWHSEHTALLKLEIGIQQNQCFVHTIRIFTLQAL